MRTLSSDVYFARGADVLFEKDFCVEKGKSVLVTADNQTDRLLIDALAISAHRLGATPCAVSIPQPPFLGTLADPFMPEPLIAATASCDV